MILYVILTFTAILIGMAVSVFAFGTGGKRSRIFQDIYFTVEEVEGIGVLYTKNGDYSAVIRMENPVQKYSANIDAYYEFASLFTALAVGLITRFFGKKLPALLTGMVLGLVLCYAFGSIWFMVLYTRSSGAIAMTAVLAKCVIPFLPVDGVKIMLAALLVRRLSPVIRL